MSVVRQRPMTAEEYDAAAWEYCATLPLEHFMEATPQATQRLIAGSSFEVLKLLRPETHFFSELLVQYWHNEMLRQVVPDNMLVIGNLDSRARSSFAIDLEPAAPFMMMEWVSESSEGKDYGESFQKYEQELKTPYYLCFYPLRGTWELYRHDGRKYVQLELDGRGRATVPELDLEVGLHQGWIRFWYRGELLAISSELQQRLSELSQQLQRQSDRIAQQSQQLAEQSQQLEQQSQQLEHQSVLMDEMLELLKRQVERRARRAGRMDVVDRLSSADVHQLEAWLDEL